MVLRASPPKVAFWHGPQTYQEILTINNLVWRKVFPVNWCFICKWYEESRNWRIPRPRSSFLLVHCFSFSSGLDFSASCFWSVGGSLITIVIWLGYIGAYECNITAEHLSGWSDLLARFWPLFMFFYLFGLLVLLSLSFFVGLSQKRFIVVTFLCTWGHLVSFVESLLALIKNHYDAVQLK